MLTWGPAHTSWASLGSRLRSDGMPLTAVDWRANGIADAAAKMAAGRHRAPAYVRRHYNELVAAHRYGAAVAGVACREANNYKSMTTDAAGGLKIVTYRDSIGRQGAPHHNIAGDDEPLHPASTTQSESAPEEPLVAALPRDFPRRPGAIQLHQAALLTGMVNDADDDPQRPLPPGLLLAGLLNPPANQANALQPPQALRRARSPSKPRLWLI